VKTEKSNSYPSWRDFAAFLLIVGLFFNCASQPAQSLSATHNRTVASASNPLLISDQLKLQIPPGTKRFQGTIAQEKVLSRLNIAQFYQLRAYQPAWVTDHGILPRARAMVDMIRKSEADGFVPEYFHFSTVSLLLKTLEQGQYLKLPIDPNRLVKLELLLTDAFLSLSYHYETGILAPKQGGIEWYSRQTPSRDPIQILTEAIDTDRVAETLTETLPQTQEYKKLRLALVDYRKIALKGGWKPIPPGKTLTVGQRDWRVPLLRKRLIASHDLSETISPPDKKLMNEDLSEALKNFQARHGIKKTGSLNSTTLKALNVSTQKRIRQILMNLERLRWLPHNFGNRYIAVNIADFSLRAIQDNKTILEMPVIVGSLYKQTPIFTGMMNNVVLNPYWYVPKSIIIESILDKIKKDPNYLRTNQFKILRKTGSKGWREVQPEEMNWDKIEDENLDLTLRRDPGPGNPLGQIKFIFSNAFSIYLHDTNEKDLFKKGTRTLSSGCIRLAKPFELFHFVMNSNPKTDPPKWDKNRIKEILDKKEQINIPIQKPVPIHMLYQTAWVDENNSLQFREDVYGRDELLDPFI